MFTKPVVQKQATETLLLVYVKLMQMQTTFDILYVKILLVLRYWYFRCLSSEVNLR